MRRLLWALPSAWLLFTLTGCELEQPEKPQSLRIAVAADFANTLEQLINAYVRQTRLDVQTMVGSSGLLAAQLEAGAPYDLFFAADAGYARQLVDKGKAQGGAQIYALGRLALWRPNPNFIAAEKYLLEDDFKRLSIANPSLSPYGAAAQQLLEKRGLWQKAQSRLVRGDNVAQAYHYVDSGMADIGFVALSQLQAQMANWQPEAVWIVPAGELAPLVQQAVVLTGPRQQQAEAFLAFCLGKEGRAIIQAAGYGLPEQE